MSDLISRQAAIDALNKLDVSDGVGISSVACDLQKEAIHSIENLPPAQPERKRGKWEIYVISMLDGEGCRCSECGLEGVPYWDFCPNCGAKMEVDDGSD